MRLPAPRGAVSAFVIEHLSSSPHRLEGIPQAPEGALEGDDFHLALYVCYELAYRSFDDVDDGWEWEPTLIQFRSVLERGFQAALSDLTPVRRHVSPPDIPDTLQAILDEDTAPSLARHLEAKGTAEQFREFVIHRSAYQLKEADPHSWAIPRLEGKAKAAMVEIQSDEYGAGRADHMHSELFRDTMEAMGMDARYGAYLDVIPGVTLATVNLMSMFGLHRRLRGSVVGHLAAFEMSSPEPNRRYGAAARRLGWTDPKATRFYDEHVEADSVHEVIAAHDLAGGLARQEPELAADILFGAECLVALEGNFARHLLASWSRGDSSLFAAHEHSFTA